MAATKKSAAEAPVVEEEVAVEAPQEEAAVEVVEEETVVSAPTQRYTAPNTWTAYYGTTVYSFIEGKTYDLPVEVATWLSRPNS